MSNGLLWQVQGNQQTLLVHNTCSAWSNRNFVSSTNHHSSHGIKTKQNRNKTKQTEKTTKQKTGRFTAWSHTHNFPHCPGWPDPIEKRGGGHLSEVTTSPSLLEAPVTFPNPFWKSGIGTSAGGPMARAWLAQHNCTASEQQGGLVWRARWAVKGQLSSWHFHLLWGRHRRLTHSYRLSHSPLQGFVLPGTSCSIMCKKSVLFISGFRKKSTRRKKEMH